MARISALILTVMMLSAACDGGSSVPPPPGSDTSPVASVAPSPSSPAALAAREIVERSSAAMADVGPYTVTTLASHRTRTDVDEEIYVEFHEALEVVALWPEFRECYRGTAVHTPFTSREKGARAVYPPESGATAPDTFELLAVEDIEGERAWRVRYRSNYPSIEGPYPVENTEWISQSDFRLLRVETEVYDPFGFVGINVAVLSGYGEGEPLCPSPPWWTEADLQPLGPFRLESPYP